MKKHFNTTGPCLPDEHYMLPTQERIADLMPLIDRRSYFVIHAARQSGKTTLLLELVKQINDVGRYHCLYCSLETLQGIVDEKSGIPALARTLAYAVEISHSLRSYQFPASANDADYSNLLRRSLASFCSMLNKPLIVFFDEADCLSNGTLISFLRQLRSGYVERSSAPFLHSVALVGMRNIRDYKGRIREDASTLGSASPFNIVKESLTLRNFTRDDIARLFRQHTEATGQVFEDGAIDRSYYWTQGQPWLVNALAVDVLERILDNDTAPPVTMEHIERAVENLIQRRDTHIDSLVERLKEERVQRVIEPMLTGASSGMTMLDDDHAYCLDMGLIRVVDGKTQPGNPIYAEVIGRTLSLDTQMHMAESSIPTAQQYVRKGQLDMNALLAEFQKFWRENSEIWTSRYQYQEAAPLLVLQAFLQRVLNGGGRIRREFAAGRGRADLCVEYANRRYVLELKIRHDSKSIGKGTQQLLDYLEVLGEKQGWLVIFDRRKKVAWSRKLFHTTQTVRKRIAHVVGC